MSKFYVALALAVLLCAGDVIAKPGNGNGNGVGNGQGNGVGNGNSGDKPAWRPASKLGKGQCYKSSDCKARRGAATCIGGGWRPGNVKIGTCGCKDPCKTFYVTGNKHNYCLSKCNRSAGETCLRNKALGTAACVPVGTIITPIPAPTTAPVPAPTPAPTPAPELSVPVPGPAEGTAPAPAPEAIVVV